MISTMYGNTPWTSYELAVLHGMNPGGAKRQQEKLDWLIVEVLAPQYVARRVRADQAANSIRCTVARLHRLLTSGDDRVGQHITRLIKTAYDQAAAGRLTAVTRRLPVSQGGVTATHRSHNPEAAGSTPAPASRRTA